MVRVFWPHPSLPRISGVGGEDARSAGTGDDEPALVLVGWWRANTRRGDDPDHRDGARPAVSSVDVVVAGAAAPEASFEADGRDPGTRTPESLGPPVVLGSLVPEAAPSVLDEKKVPRRNPKKQTRRTRSRKNANACPVRLLARLEPGTSPSLVGDFLTVTRNEHLPIGAFGDFSVSTTRVVRYATPNPPAEFFGSKSASAPFRWALRAANEAGRLANGTAKKTAVAYRDRRSFAIPRQTRACAAAVANALEHKWVPGLRRRHAWLAPRRRGKSDVSDSEDVSDSDDSNDSDTGGTAKQKSRTDSSRALRQKKERERDSVVFRDACELFASAKVIRSRARWIARGGDGADVPAEVFLFCPSLRRALVFGRALQVCLDLVLGFALQEVLLANADALVAFAAGEDVEWLPNARGENGEGGGAFFLFRLGRFAAATRRNRQSAKIRTPPLGDLIRDNAEWLMRGSPLGVKLHAPLARALGAAAMLLVEALGSVVSSRPFRRGIRFCVSVVARAGPLGGASLSLALAADLTTFLTTHVAALHVYSSLLVTAQWHFGKKLVAVVASRHEKKTVHSSTFGVLALTPLGLLFPTTLAFYLSYLAIHAFTVFARASLVFLAAAAQHAPLEAVVVRLTHPKAFPGETEVRRIDSGGAKTTKTMTTNDDDDDDDDDDALILFCRPAGAFETSTFLFASAAARWTGATLRAVAGACGSLGRLPVALVPFEPERAELFRRRDEYIVDK